MVVVLKFLSMLQSTLKHRNLLKNLGNDADEATLDKMYQPQCVHARTLVPNLYKSEQLAFEYQGKP